MRYENTCRFIGNVTSAPKHRVAKSLAITDIQIAVNRPSNKAGAKTTTTDYLPITFLGNVAERAKALKKGDLVQVMAECHLDRWTDAASGEGKTRLSLKGVLFSILQPTFVGKDANSGAH